MPYVISLNGVCDVLCCIAKRVMSYMAVANLNKMNYVSCVMM